MPPQVHTAKKKVADSATFFFAFLAKAKKIAKYIQISDGISFKKRKRKLTGSTSKCRACWCTWLAIRDKSQRHMSDETYI